MIWMMMVFAGGVIIDGVSERKGGRGGIFPSAPN